MTTPMKPEQKCTCAKSVIPRTYHNCPIHGECMCVFSHRDGSKFTNVDSRACPLHGTGKPPEPTSPKELRKLVESILAVSTQFEWIEKPSEKKALLDLFDKDFERLLTRQRREAKVEELESALDVFDIKDNPSIIGAYMEDRINQLKFGKTNLKPELMEGK